MNNKSNNYEVIVVGGGHAGTEAAHAAARAGRRTLLLTHNLETLGQMSCNPSIGGIGKGHLVKEIDALGGIMGEATDEAGIQFRILNSTKGPAVQATRAQADRVLYRRAIRRRLEAQPNLFMFQQEVAEILMHNARVMGVRTQSGVKFLAPSVILTTGTFLNGLIHVGLEKNSAGRAGDPASLSLASHLKDLALPMGRLKTGTPPRLDGRTIDFSVLEVQAGDTDPVPVFSFLGSAADHPPQMHCWMTHTNERTHEIIRMGLDRSPLYTGVIAGVGPRYCPSIEDKVHRFAERTSHQIFLEPEGLSTHEVYPNGISTSLPWDVQCDLVHSMRGLENAHLLRPGYAIEYDYCDPRALTSALAVRAVRGLFFAGQINGTTGYEEAAAQGLLAGINAARLDRDEPWFPGRHEAYLGVLVDDLVTRGVSEPYRMFTSRAEYRLSLREDNADLRLTEIGRKLGVVNDARWQSFCRKRDTIGREQARLACTRVNVARLPTSFTLAGQKLDHDATLEELLRRPEVSYDDLASLSPGHGQDLPRDVIRQIEIQAHYSGYIERQRAEIRRLEEYESLPLPASLDYAAMAHLSVEVRQRLSEHRPATLGQASRLYGMTPAAVSLLLVYVRRHQQTEKAEAADIEG